MLKINRNRGLAAGQPGNEKFCGIIGQRIRNGKLTIVANGQTYTAGIGGALPAAPGRFLIRNRSKRTPSKK